MPNDEGLQLGLGDLGRDKSRFKKEEEIGSGPGSEIIDDWT